MTYVFLPGWSLNCKVPDRFVNGACMEKMFVSLEGSSDGSASSAFATPETMRSKVAIASYRCKLYRAQLDQLADSGPDCITSDSQSVVMYHWIESNRSRSQETSTP